MQACQSSSYITPGAIGGAVNCDMQPGLDIYDHNIGQTVEQHLYLAALVRTAGR